MSEHGWLSFRSGIFRRYYMAGSLVATVEDPFRIDESVDGWILYDIDHDPLLRVAGPFPDLDSAKAAYLLLLAVHR